MTYTLPPQAPTGFAKGDITTSSIIWNWTDNATADTGNVIHDASHVVKCTTGDIEGTGSNGSCEEIGLSANTQYTRHANAIDAHATTDSSPTSAYTAIETPSGIAIDSVSGTAITVHASGTISDLGQGQSALLFVDSSTGRDSGWVTVNSWTESGLAEDSVHAVTVTARNGDGVETSATAPEQLMTLASVPDVVGTRSTSTWYSTGPFNFTNGVAWGAGGVQYNRYVWNQNSTYSFNGTESTWSDADAKCPGGSCTTASAILSNATTVDGNDWYLHVRSYNGDDVPADSGASFGPYFFDGTAPVIAAPAATTTTTAATVTWTTDEPTTGQLEWGTTSGYGNTTTLNPVLATTHTAQLTGLTAGATFHVRALGTDVAGNPSTSSDTTFTTLTIPQTLITNVSVSSRGQTSATVTWTTNEPATSKVRYGPTTDYGLEVSDVTLVTSHSMSLISLTAGTTYHYEVISVGSTTDHDADATFTTVAAEVQPPSPDLTPTPPTASAITDARVIAGETIATFYWTTDEPAASKVDCGEKYSKSSVTETESHRVQIAGFYPGASYGCVLTSGDATYPVSFITATPAATTHRAIGPTILELTPQSGTIPTLTAIGVAKGDQTIRAYIDGTLVKTVTTETPSSETRQFTIVVSLSTLKKGTHTLYLQSTDQNGRTSMIRQRVTFTVQSGGTGATIGTTTGTPLTYTVKQGDSLWRIAQRCLGDGSRYDAIVEANKRTYPALVVNPSLIRQGMVLKVPAR